MMKEYNLKPSESVVFDPSTSIYLDFEFNKIANSNVNLVSCATVVEGYKPKSFWLHSDKKEQAYLRDYLKEFKTIVGYSAVAEARSMMALGLNVFDFNILDLFLEYRMITNNNDLLTYGRQLIKGKVKRTFKPPPKWERHEGFNEHEEGDDEDEVFQLGFRPTHSLAEATYKLLSTETNPVIRDTKEKDEVRDLIISAPHLFTIQEQERILKYGIEDIRYLPQIRKKIREIYDSRMKYKNPKYIKMYDSDSFIRGRYSCHTAEMEQRGYPINYEATLNFSRQANNILFDAQRDFNKQFEDVRPFVWNKKEQRFSMKQDRVCGWIESYMHNSKSSESWPTTKKGKLSLKVDTWTKFFPYKHDYPVGNFGAQMVRYLKLKRELSGFVRSKTNTRRTFWDSVGEDKRVRPYLNHYGAQSSRSQPLSTAFLFLKPAWMRALCEPPPGKALGGIDWRSQEFLLAALLSKDMNMIEAYFSGDPYAAFGRMAKFIPPDGNKHTHPEERDMCKSSVLGISYQMSKYGLAIKLTEDTGKKWDEDKAQEIIDDFYDVFSDLYEYQQDVIDDYEANKFLRLPCGWTMWGDNDNARSVNNVPVQGLGASIMRVAVEKAKCRGLEVIFTLHDAIYIQFNVGDEYKLKILGECMREATAYYFEGPMKKYAYDIGLDPFAWSPEYPKVKKYKNLKTGKIREVDNEIIVDGFKIPIMQKYIDERSIKEYKTFSHYFEDKIEFYL